MTTVDHKPVMKNVLGVPGSSYMRGTARTTLAISRDHHHVVVENAERTEGFRRHASYGVGPPRATDTLHGRLLGECPQEPPLYPTDDDTDLGKRPRAQLLQHVETEARRWVQLHHGGAAIVA